jgi:hypothetical protein
VDREICRALGIRSILAAPVRQREKSIGIVEVFSARPNQFSESDGGVLQRLADTVVAAVNRAPRTEDMPSMGVTTTVPPFSPTPGSVLFASVPGQEKKMEGADEKLSGGISLPRSHLILLIAAAITIFMILGYKAAPLIQKWRKRAIRLPKTFSAFVIFREMQRTELHATKNKPFAGSSVPQIMAVSPHRPNWERCIGADAVYPGT